MAAAKGNNYHSRWTVEKANTFFDNILEYVNNNKKCYSITEAAVKVGEYEDLVRYLKVRFPDQDFASIKKAKGIIKNRLMTGGLFNDVNATMAIFILKNNHDMYVEGKNKESIIDNITNTEEIKEVKITFSDASKKD